ncbi:MAG: hypothetical protein ABIW84_00645, partial [Ilumatobacteraceae bacterium]
MVIIVKPMYITSRLMAGLDIDDGTIHLSDESSAYRWIIEVNGTVLAEDNDLASLIAYLRNLPAILCKVCAEPITRVIEEHAIYWEASDGD